jgi:predicted HTH domain antitoxin
VHETKPKNSNPKKGKIMSRMLVLEFPEEVQETDLRDKDVLLKAKEGAVMELFHKGKISQGKAAELLDRSRNDLLDLMARYDVPAFEATPEELNEGLKNLKTGLGRKQG